MNWSTVIRQCWSLDQLLGLAGCAILLLALPFIAAAVPEPAAPAQATERNLP